MKTLKLLWSDDAGFIISAELVLVATVAVLAMVVGQAEVGSAVNQELEDVGSAVGAVQQSYYYSGVESRGKAQFTAAASTTRRTRATVSST